MNDYKQGYRDGYFAGRDYHRKKGFYQACFVINAMWITFQLSFLFWYLSS